MKLRVLSLVFLLVLPVFTGCASKTTLEKQHISKNGFDNRPSWILNPNQNGKLGAVGSSMRTYDQKLSTQRKLAITRALDELSLQKGVDVNMSLNKQETYVNNYGSSSMDVNASYKTNSSITAHIEAVYQDKLTGELFIWMVLD